MFEYKGVTFSQEDVENRAKEKGLSLEDYLLQNKDINRVEVEKPTTPQTVDAPAESDVTASNSAVSFSELPTYTDNPETVKKAKEAGFDVLPGARQEGDTIMGVMLPEATANPLTFEEQLDKEKSELEEKSNSFYTELMKAQKVMQQFEFQNLGDGAVEKPTQDKVDQYNEMVAAYNSMLNTGQEELKTLSTEYDKRVNEFNQQSEQQKVTAKQSIKNSFSNLIQDGKNVVDYYFGEGVGLDLATDQIYRSIFGDERIDAYIQRNKDKPFLVEGLLTDEQRIQKIEAFKNKQQDRKPTLGVIESFAEGNLGDQAASVLSAIVNVGGSVVYNTGTAGTGYFMDFAAQNYIDYNTEVAEAKGKTLEQLILDGEDNGNQAIRLASLQAGAEYFGYRKIKKALGGKMSTPTLMPKKIRDKFNYSPRAKTTLNVLTTGVSESATEIFQGAVEEYNKKSAIDPDVSFSNTILEYAQSPEGMESGVQGFLGASGLATGSYSARAVAQTRRGVDGLKVEAQINEILSISEQIQKAKDPTVIKGLEEKRDVKTQELQRNIKKGNDIYSQLSEGDITELESIYDIADVQAARAVELQRKFNRRKISEQEYKSALEGYRDSYEAAQARATQILADKTAENVEQQIKELGKSGVKGKITRLGKSEIASDQSLGEIAEQASNEYGFIKQFGDGSFEIIINTDKQPKLTEVHELGHALLYKTIGNNKEIQDNLGDALIEHVSKIKGDKTALGKRLASYGQFNDKGEFVRDANFGEEVVVLMSESIADGSLKFEETFFTKIGDTIRRFLQRSGLREVRLDTGRDVFNFVKDYTASISEGKIDKAIIKVATEGAKGKLVDQPIKDIKQDVTKFSRDVASQEVQDIYEQQGEAGVFDIFEKFKPITTRIARRFRDVPGYDEQLIIDEIETGERGILDLVRAYKPESGVPLAAYINKFLPARSIEAGNRVLKTQFEEDVTEAKGVEAEETVEQQPERKTKLKVLADQLNVADKVKSEVAEANIDPNTLTNFKSVPNAAINTVGELLGISPAKIKSKANLTATEVASAQRWFNKNAQFVIDALPQGFDTEGKATGVPKTVLEALYTKREARAKTKAGLRTQVKRPNIKNSELLELVDIIDGKPTRNRNTSARIIALSDLLGKVMTNQEVRQTFPGVERIRSGMSEVMFSKDNYNNINIEADAVPLIIIQKEQENINKLYKSQRDLGAIYKDNKTVLEAGAESINNFLKSYPKHREFISNTMTGGVTGGFFLTKPEFDKVIDQVSAKQSTESLDKGYRVKYNDKRKFVGEKLFQDKDFLADKKKRLPAMYDFFKDLESHLKANPQDSWIFREMARDTGKHQNAFTRVLAPFTFYPAKNGKAITNQLVVEEHSMPQNNVMKSMLNAAVAGTVDEQFKVTKAAFMQGSFLETDDKIVNDSGMKESMPDVFYDKIAPRIKNGELEVDVDGLLAVVRLAAAGTKYAPINIEKTVNLNNYLIGETKQTIAEYFGIDKIQDIELANISLIESLAGEKEISYSKDIISKNISNVRPVLAYSKDSKGMSTFDFDETLIIDGENFIIAEKDGVKRKVVSGDWPIIGPQLAEEGYKFDFTDFVNVRGGVDGPLLQKMKNQIKKYGPRNVFVLTARPPQAATAIHEWLKTKNINIPFENITGLGNSTGDAKASWMLEKYQEGYNDMYFVDDALPNVEAVQHVFDQLDVKGKSVQARIQFSKDLDSEFNKMIERKKGVAAEKEFSRVVGQKRGKNIGRYRFFVPPSANDFAGLLYDFYGKGKQGDADIEFMKKALLDPFARADREMSQARMSILEDYKMLRKELPDIKKKLGKLIDKESGFTFDNAVRVYLFDKAGFEVPGISKRDLASLKNTINTDQDLKTFADTLSIISKRKEGWIKPSENWSVETIAADLENIVNKIGRKQYLSEFIENKNIIFSTKNLNKIEAVYGSRFREALEDSLYRMENGTNRSAGRSYGQAWTNWVNGSVGAIMFFNARSAVLQTLSTVNFINFQDNNIFKAGKALANQKQYWSDFSTLFNSDFLKARRAGLQINVNEAELANAVAGAQNKAKAALAYLLKKGFLPTQIADSFAIASGGSTFYRNRINTYVKQGMDKKAAEEKAFLDFQEIAQETQQSSRPDRISQQQASPLGRLILAFANTPMQYNRLIKKAALDLSNNRGDWRSNVSRILYYGAIQNVIFSSLQSAIFALSFEDEEDDELDSRAKRVLNGTIDTLLRGSGVAGAAVATAKNVILRFISEAERKSRADYGQVVVEALQVSPPLGSKARKTYSALNSYKFNREIMGSMDTFDYNNPIWDAAANVTTAATNVPLDRLFRKADNIKEAFNQENSNMQRAMLLLGWSTWDLQVGERIVVNKGKPNQYVRYLDSKRQAQQEAKEELKEKKKEVKKAKQCTARSRATGRRCQNTTTNKSGRCYAHNN